MKTFTRLLIVMLAVALAGCGGIFKLTPLDEYEALEQAEKAGAAAKITELATATVGAAGDVVAGVDVSDTSMAATGTTKQYPFSVLSTFFNSDLAVDDLITLSGLAKGSTALADPNGDITATTIDGALTEFAAAIELNTAKVTMAYPGAGVPNSTGSAWGTSYGVQTSVRTEGSSTDTDLVTEDAIRDLLAAPGAIGGTTPATSIKADELDITASASPLWGFKDSDAPGTDKEVAAIGAQYLSGADGAEYGAWTAYAHINGTRTAILNFDDTGYWESSYWPTFNQATTGSAGSLKSVATTGLMTITGPAAGETRAKTVRDANDTLLELGGAYTPTGNWTWTSASGSTWPTFNQSTTGSAASLAISGQSGLLTFDGLTSTNRAKTVRDAADTLLELGGSYTPTGTWVWTSASVTWPTFNQNTSGTAANVTGTVAIANGGTGAATATANYGFFGPATGAEPAAPSFRAMVAADIPADSIDEGKIADDGIDSEHYNDGSIDAAHLAADVIDESKIADDGIDSEHYNDGSIDAAHLAADVIDESKIADDGIDSEHYNDGSVDAVHISDWYAYDTLPIAWAADGTSAPDPLDDRTTRAPYQYRTFAAGADEDVNFVWFVPSDLSGTTIQFRVKYLVTHATGPSESEGVAFALSGVSIGDNDPTNGAKGTPVVVTDGTLNAVQHDLLITGWSGDVTVTNLAAGEIAELAFIRDVSDEVDNYGQVVGVVAVEIRYTQNVAK